MGTATGHRTRKYHGFHLGMVGRSETAGLLDFDMTWGGHQLWPHLFRSPTGQKVQTGVMILPRFEIAAGPKWTWELAVGTRLQFEVEGVPRTGIRLRWSFSGRRKALASKTLKIRPFFAMRPLSHVGGESWAWEPLDSSGRVRVLSGSGRELFCRVAPGLSWTADPVWYERFFYPEEAERGYDSTESLFAGGYLTLDPRESSDGELLLAASVAALDRPRKRREFQGTSAIHDFVLEQPAGITAGYPWFGEWGRDTFVSLPGIVGAKLHEGEGVSSVLRWTGEVIDSWGSFIRSNGMLPNLVEKDGVHQWES